MKKLRLTQLLFVGLTALLLVFPLLQSSTVAKGADLTGLSQAKIISVQVPSDVLKTAQQDFPKHMYAIIKNPSDYGYTAAEVGKFALGNPFNIYQYDGQAVSNTGIYYFPVMAGNEIKAMLAVSKADDGTFSSTFSPSFAKELQNVLSTTSEPIRFFTTNGEVRAITSKEDVVIGDAGDGTQPLSLNKTDIIKVNELAMANAKAQKYNEAASDVVSSNLSNSVITPDSVGGPISYIYLNVPVFYQYDTEYCWACTMASLLDYTHSMSLTRDSVVASVPHDGDGSASEIEIDNGYLHYLGVYPYTVHSDLTYEQVVGCLQIDKPCHSFWALEANPKIGHSMEVRGYELYSDGSKNYCLMDPHQGNISVIGHSGSINQTVYNYSSRSYRWGGAKFI